MVAEDIAASIAHVHALRDAGVLTDDEDEALAAALVEVAAGVAAGTIVAHDHEEDIHSVVERAVTDRLGELGGKLHAGRSRNDLVVTDLRLWLLAAGERSSTLLTGLAGALVERAREHTSTWMPGTTHGRAAQPVSLAHHLLAHAWALTRDLERMRQWADRTSTSPLGAGAIATSTLPLDPAASASRLGFRRVFANSLDAVSDRDFVQEFIGACAIVATHLSRLGADLARWTDSALGWAQLDEAYSTGSSMMPHKRNPDTVELARGKAARIAGDMVSITALLQGLPLGYHRDLQEDKEPAFDAADTLALVVPALTGAVRTVRFDTAAMLEACRDDGLYATDVAEALVAAGVAFRVAHRRTGELLRRLAEGGRTLYDLAPEEWVELGLAGGGALLDPARSVAARAGMGGPSPRSVDEQIVALTSALAANS